MEIGRRESGRCARTVFLPSLSFVAYVPAAGTSWSVVALLGAGTTGFWGKFVAASALIEEDPAKACEELRRLAPVADEVLEKLSRAEEAIEGGAESSRAVREPEAPSGGRTKGARTRPSEKGGDDERE